MYPGQSYIVVDTAPGLLIGEQKCCFYSLGTTYTFIVKDKDIQENRVRVYVVQYRDDEVQIDLPRVDTAAKSRIWISRDLVQVVPQPPPEPEEPEFMPPEPMIGKTRRRIILQESAD
jgi:hypothetical protein